MFYSTTKFENFDFFFYTSLLGTTVASVHVHTRTHTHAHPYAHNQTYNYTQNDIASFLRSTESHLIRKTLVFVWACSTEF
jgi:hypothetical protein